MLALLLCLTTAATYAQADARPKIFQNFPETMDVSASTFQNLFSTQDGDDVSLNLAGTFNFPGKVISNSVKYSNLQTIVIISPQFNNAIFNISKITNADNTISYEGRIINERAFDGYELKQNADGTYTMKKFEMGKVLQPCNF